MKSSLSFVALFMMMTHLCAQDSLPKRSTDKFEEEYQRMKDSLALLYPNVPTVSSVLIKDKQVEVIFFNALISANRYRDDDGELIDLALRQTYFFSSLQINYGVSKNDRLNVGVGFQSTFGRLDQDRESSIFKVFSRQTDGISLSARSVTAIVPRIRWRPIAHNYRLTWQSGLSLPTTDRDKQQILGRRQVFLLNQVIYNQPLSDRFFLLSQLGLQYGFKKENTPAIFSTPVSLYLSHFIPRKTVLFALANYVPLFIKNGNRHSLQAGLGAQYQISSSLLVNGYYANELVGKNYPDYSSYTIGIRWVSP